MPGDRFDVVVVGARCAGAALGTFLARSGAKVLLVDRAALPSDQILSTHTIHPPGIDVLDELGVGDAMREVTPPSRVARIRKGDAWVDVPFRPGRAEYCPRRERLDGLIQDAAVRAGAELRDRTRATRVLFEGERAVGVEIERAEKTETIAAPLVVGADGRHSLVARYVGAREYMGYDIPRAMYWAYWDAPAEWRGDRYPFDMYLARIGEDIRTIFPTDHGQLLLGSLPPVETALTWRSDAAAALRRNLAGDPVIAPLLAAAGDARTSIRGSVKERCFFRSAAGEGWALVGDAGHHKEFVVGDGITEALIQARSLARAYGGGGEAALEGWWRERDVAALPGYFWGRDEGSLGPPPEIETILMRRIARDDRLRRRMIGPLEHECSHYDAIPPGAVLPAAVGALLRGRFGVVKEVATQMRRIGAYRRAMKERTALAREAGGAA